MQQLLHYYLSSPKYFGGSLEWFLKSYHHVGVCGDSQLPFESGAYRDRISPWNQGWPITFDLSDQTIQKHFSTEYSDHQLFAVIVAEGIGMSENQIHQIADRRYPDKSWDRLNFFLWHPQEDGVTKTDHPLPYYVDTSAGEITAVYRDGALVASDTGMVLRIY